MVVFIVVSDGLDAVVDSSFFLVVIVVFGDLVVSVLGGLEVDVVVVVVPVDLENVVAPGDLGVVVAVLGDLKLVVPGNLETIAVPGNLVVVCDVIGDLAVVAVVVSCILDEATTVSGVKVAIVPTCKTRQDK